MSLIESGSKEARSIPSESDRERLERAIELAQLAEANHQLPIGCVIFDQDGIELAAAHNLTVELDDKTAHAELLAIREAMKKGNGKEAYEWSLYTTLEPCPMCFSAIVLSKIGRVVWAATDGHLDGWDVATLPYRHADSVEVAEAPFDDLRQISHRLYLNGKNRLRNKK